VSDAGRTLDVLAVEPWNAGSHAAFLLGLMEHSRHRVRALTLPGRFWKWRQTGSGLVLGARAARGPRPDLVFASDYLHLPDFLAVTRRAWGPPPVPAILYFHENQLSYPLKEGHDLDRAYALANLSGAAAADAVWFNSAYHREAFRKDLEALLSACPDHAPVDVGKAIAARSRVVPLGVDLAALDRHAGPAPRTGPLTLLWNHRWEHDKNPEGFFHACFRLAEAGADFRVIVLGQSFSEVPPVFAEVRQRLGPKILHFGWVPERATYARLVSRADVVVSLAHHDFFGVAVVEAMHLGCLPLLAGRLNYPDLVPPEAHGRCLVADADDLVARLMRLADDPAAARTGEARAWAARHDWRHAVTAFDSGFDSTFVAASDSAFSEAGSGGTTLRATDPDLGRDM
jgi:glycosyltransferase involved in cell wall biosynthesis